MAVASDESVLDWIAGVQRGQVGLYEELCQIHEDLHAIALFLTRPSEHWNQPVSQRVPLQIDKRGFEYLYIFAPVALELFYADLPSQIGSTAQAPLIIPAGRFVELPFQTGDKLYCPGIAVTAEVTVKLVGRNTVLVQ